MWNTSDTGEYMTASESRGVVLGAENKAAFTVSAGLPVLL